MSPLLLRGGTVISAQHSEQKDIFIEDGTIRELRAASCELRANEEIVADNFLVLPGLIDCHVHFREPGLTHKGDMESESRAAIAGGVTTVCDMPNTVPPTVTIAAFADKVRRAHVLQAKSHRPLADIRFFFGVTEARHLLALRDLLIGSSVEMRRLKERCCGVKLYLDHSTGNQKVATALLDEIFARCAEWQVPVVVHAEDAEMHEKMRTSDGGLRTADVSVHSLMRPPESEERAVERAIDLVRRHGTQLHIAHLSTRQGLTLVRKAKRDGLPVTCEVAPHHLFLTVDDYETLGTLVKMNPPLRAPDHQEALWEGLHDGTIDCIATDHAPHTLGEKRVGNPLLAPSGVPGVETMLPLLLTVAAGRWPHPKRLAARSSQLAASNIVRLCFDNPNRIFRLGKQEIAEGTPAECILVDPDAEWTIHAKDLHSKCGWTPYEGWKVKGKVVRVMKEHRQFPR